MPTTESVLFESEVAAAEVPAAAASAAAAVDGREADASVFTPTAIIGAALPRIDGPLKTTGRATYAADYSFPRLVYAVGLGSTIGSGKVTNVDASAAEKMPGVLLVMTHENMGDLLHTAPGGRSGTGEGRIALSDANVNYWGQYVAVAVAETFEQAQAAAGAVRVEYDAGTPNVSADFFADPNISMRTNSKRGDTAAAFESASVKVDQTYTTPAETHNPMEMHATVAVWDGTNFTLYESSQNVMGFQRSLAGALGVAPENLRVISRFIGSGFGGKLSPWPQAVLAAAAARKLNRPVKMTVSRKMMFSAVGHRPATEQRMRIGATPDGKLVSLEHNYRNHSSMGDNVGENCGESTPYLYSTPNLTVTSGIVKRNVGTPCPMRGPGAVPGLFAVESAMDELAIALKMDPVELRLRNDTLLDESSNNRPFSGRHYKECLQTGAEHFGWSRRTPAVGSMRKGDVILGWGVAGASWGAGAGGSQATVILKDDGTARVSSGTQDPGTGTYTVMAQVLSDRTGIPVERIDVVIGDSTLVPGPGSGGSRATATIIPAVADGADAAVKALLTLSTQTTGSPFSGQDPASLAFTSGRVHLSGKPPASGVPFQEVLKLTKTDSVTGNGHGTGAAPEARNYSTHSFGAQFAEVEWDPGIAHLRVTRVVSVIDGGRIINMKTAANQVAGSVIMGIGMALFEQNIYDPRNGDPVNSNFADYLVPTNADSPSIDVHFIDIPDNLIGQYGARGIGEIGLAGVAPAITAAVYHATGVRVRNLPVRIEDLLTAQA